MGQSPRRWPDLEAGRGRSEEDGTPTKHVPVDRRSLWMRATLVLNASRRFRYTRDLKQDEQAMKRVQEIRTDAQAKLAAKFSPARGQQGNGIPKPSTPAGDFGISQEQIAVMTVDRDVCTLAKYKGVERLAELLKTDLAKGIHGDDADMLARKNTYGSNAYPRKKGKNFWMFLWEACQNLILIILIIAAVASLLLDIKTEGIKEGWYNGGSIAFGVILTVVVTAISDYRQSLQFQHLNEEKRNIHSEVVRGGRRVKISIYDIVVGDVVPLNIGDHVPADGVLISGHSLAIDESNMTGESELVRKDAGDPFLMSGCKVADGCGTMLVTSVGINTKWGLLMPSISEDTGEQTSLEDRLNGVATIIGYYGLAVAAAVLVVLLIGFFTGRMKNPDVTVQLKAGKTSVSDTVDGVIKKITVAVTIVIVAVPEGLPLAVTLTLAYSMRKMLADKALVRRRSALETMGSVTTICCHKTGTLTLNQMTVVEAHACGREVDLPDSNSQLSTSLTSLLFEAICQNLDGSVYVPEGGGDVEVSGSPTAKAILKWGIKLGMDFQAVRSRSSIIHVFPFNSEEKRGRVAVRLPDSEVHIHWIGAAEIVLARCTKYMDANDQEVAMDEDKKMYFEKAVADMAARSLCCVAIAYRPYDIEGIPLDEEQLTEWALPEDELILLAIVGIKDPCRPGVKDGVQLCKEAGIKVRMVTGDNLQTAKAIALECGILDPEADADVRSLTEGKNFRSLTDADREKDAEKILVMGRSSSNDRLLLVRALKRRGDIVAVTGIGTYDAPALHEADVGLSMGIRGTQVAKESSDIIILDDNFATVVKAVRWGRSVYANTEKFIQFQLTVNLAATIINAVAVFTSGDVPLNAVQLLWVNLIMDTHGLALVTEPPTDDLMHGHLVGRREPLITKSLCINIAKHVVYQLGVLLIIKYQGRKMLGLEHDTSDHANEVQDTVIFNAFVFCQIFNEFYARESDKINVFKRITKNRLFMGMIGLTLVLQVIIIELLGRFTSTVRLNWKHWIISIIVPLGSWPLDVLQKFFGW